MLEVLPVSEPASKVSAIQRRCWLPCRTTTAGAIATLVVVEGGFGIEVVVVGSVVRGVARVVAVDDVELAVLVVANVGGDPLGSEPAHEATTNISATADLELYRRAGVFRTASP
jgi:hypothetical protein